MYTREKLLKSRQTQCQWKTEGYCSITEFDKCKTCKAIHTKPLGLNSLMIDGCTKSYTIKNFTMVKSTIRIVTEDKILYLDYFDIEDMQIINS